LGAFFGCCALLQRQASIASIQTANFLSLAIEKKHFIVRQIGA